LSVPILFSDATESTIIGLFTAALTPITTIVVLYIAYRQYKTDYDKLRHDLYEKRIKVYKSIMFFLSGINESRGVSLEEIQLFTNQTYESIFLFDPEVTKHIEKIGRNARKLSYLNHEFKRRKELSVDELVNEYDRMDKDDDEFNRLVSWFNDQFEITNRLFMKYLSFKHTML
jgi:hypothetical protein